MLRIISIFRGISSKILYINIPNKINKISDATQIVVTVNTKFFLIPVQLQKDFGDQLLKLNFRQLINQV